MTVLLMILLFVLLIFPHELGHFLMAKACKVQVNEFAFGMGPTLLKKQGKETLYSLRAIPIGGFCAMEGEDAKEESASPRAFNNKKWWQKILILLAGAAMNVVIAFIALTIMNAVGGNVTKTLAAVPESGPAYTAGIRAGDEIMSVNEVETTSWNMVVERLNVETADGKDVNITVRRSGELIEYKVTPHLTENGYKVGIEAKVTHNIFTAIKNSVIETGELFTVIVRSFHGIFESENPLDEVSGPIGMVQVVQETKTYGALFYLFIVALISVNLAMFNLLPFPALDGGRIIFVIIRMITGKAISDKAESIVHAAGMVVLIALAILIAGNDILRLLK